MLENAKWIWLDKEKFPDYQICPASTFDHDVKDPKFAIVEFKKHFDFNKKVKSVDIDISADVKFFLSLNNKYIGMGPVNSGGDFGIHIPMPVRYYNSYTVDVNAKCLEFCVLVQHLPDVMCDMSQGSNGLIASISVLFEDGSKETYNTDTSWLVRLSSRHLLINKTDYTIPESEWTTAAYTDVKCELKKASIPMLETEEIMPVGFETIGVAPESSFTQMYYFDKIYSFYTLVEACGGDAYDIVIEGFEKFEDKISCAEVLTGSGDINFRGIRMHSAGGFRLSINNRSNAPLTVKKVSADFTHYPVTDEGSFVCSEPVFNKIYNMGKHALKICRQTIELDSPLHQENLGCSGDYLIASLMNYFTYGDTRLTRLDIVRIGDCLKLPDGYMFHTTYSMMWIMMIHDYYMFTGDAYVFDEISDSLEILLEKMRSYEGNGGLINNPPSYMFVDWLEVDGFSLHHPPMAMGQAVLNAFYVGGLTTASKLYEFMKNYELADKYSKRASQVKESFNNTFYDKERGLYFDGLNDKYEPKYWLPENTDKRYFSWHTNTLAVLYDIAPEKEHRSIMEKILADMTIINPQPYFMHFVLEAIYKAGLFESHGIDQLMRWKDMTMFEKGLQEGWYDVSGYGFDYSHVWAGTPTYQLPSKFLGFEMLEPGFKKIRLKPDLFGLDYADISMPTPYGYITAVLKKSECPVITLPDGITLVE